MERGYLSGRRPRLNAFQILSGWLKECAYMQTSCCWTRPSRTATTCPFCDNLMVASPLATCNIRQRADQWHLKNRAASSARPRGSRPARVGKSVAATSERDAAADAPADDEADRQRERHDDARVPARAHEACFHSLSSGKIFVRTPKRLGHRLGGGR